MKAEAKKIKQKGCFSPEIEKLTNKNKEQMLFFHEIKNELDVYDKTLDLKSKNDKLDDFFDKNKEILIKQHVIEEKLQAIIEQLKELNQLVKADLVLSDIQEEVNILLDTAIEFAQKAGVDTLRMLTHERVNELVPLPATHEAVRLNDLGLPMHPLEEEVAELVEQAKAGEQVFPKYNRREHENPLAYLEKYYGKYLKRFNGEADYLYQDYLGDIDKGFRINLANWLTRNIPADHIRNYVPTKSDRLDSEALIVSENKLYNSINHKKINSLSVSRKL